MQSTSREMLGWKKHKLESRLPGEISSRSPPLNAPIELPALPEIRAHEAEMIAIRRQIHQNPELAYEETATADLVAAQLARWGCEVHRGLGGTGVVGTLRAGTSTRRVGLRADMDAQI